MICSITEYSCFDDGGTPPLITSDITDCSTIYPILANSYTCTDPVFTATVSSELSTQSAKLVNDTVNIISIGFAMVILAIGVTTALRYVGGRYL